MKVDVIVSKYMANNTLYLSNNGYSVIVDPSFEKKNVLNQVGDDKVIAIAITHGHYDHFASADYLAEYFDVPIYAHKNEIKDMRDPAKHLFFNPKINLLTWEKVVEIEDGQLVDFGHGIKLKAIRVEGHTSDSICFYSEEDKFLISGDTIFCGTVGRVDYYKNDMDGFIKNIKEKLLVLPDDTLIYPGHGQLTSVKEEKERSFYNEDIYK